MNSLSLTHTYAHIYSLSLSLATTPVFLLLAFSHFFSPPRSSLLIKNQRTKIGRVNFFFKEKSSPSGPNSSPDNHLANDLSPGPALHPSGRNTRSGEQGAGPS